MAKLIDLAAFRRARRRITFQKHELRQLMNLYSRRVANGEWRDYAIDYDAGMAIFSVFRHTHEHPLYRIAKVARKGDAGEEWVVVSGHERLARTRALPEALAVFERKLTLVGSG